MAAASFIVIVLLFLIASFGVGFILNMFVKRFPWTSTVVAVVLAGACIIALQTAWLKLLTALPVLIGGVAASLTIRTLQRRGFKMFG